MKRSEINGIVARAASIFARHGWTLPPDPKWDVTDFGLDKFREFGLVLVNLTEQVEYCEKLMLGEAMQHVFAHTHRLKKEDIISRFGTMAIQVWDNPEQKTGSKFTMQKSGVEIEVESGDILYVQSGERVTLVPGIYHAFWAVGDYCVIGEVSTANDDTNDNVFADDKVARFAEIEEDTPPLVRLVSES
jgi:D-lyxose ketol-isomerase